MKHFKSNNELTSNNSDNLTLVMSFVFFLQFKLMTDFTEDVEFHFCTRGQGSCDDELFSSLVR